jgi:hypothetical protein
MCSVWASRKGKKKYTSVILYQSNNSISGQTWQRSSTDQCMVLNWIKENYTVRVHNRSRSIDAFNNHRSISTWTRQTASLPMPPPTGSWWRQRCRGPRITVRVQAPRELCVIRWVRVNCRWDQWPAHTQQINRRGIRNKQTKNVFPDRALERWLKS